MSVPQEPHGPPDEKETAVPVVSVPAEEESTSAQHELVQKAIPWTYKWIALACVVAFPIGQNWNNASLGLLKNTLTLRTKTPDIYKDADPLTRRRPVKAWTIYVICALVAMVATGWTLFIRYLS